MKTISLAYSYYDDDYKDEYVLFINETYQAQDQECVLRK